MLNPSRRLRAHRFVGSPPRLGRAAPGVPGVKLIRYKPHRPVGPKQHPTLRRMEDAVRHGQAVVRLLLSPSQLSH